MTVTVPEPDADGAPDTVIGVVGEALGFAAVQVRVSVQVKDSDVLLASQLTSAKLTFPVPMPVVEAEQAGATVAAVKTKLLGEPTAADIADAPTSSRKVTVITVLPPTTTLGGTGPPTARTLPAEACGVPRIATAEKMAIRAAIRLRNIVRLCIGLLLKRAGPPGDAPLLLVVRTSSAYVAPPFTVSQGVISWRAATLHP
jgi:hypothetical protein